MDEVILAIRTGHPDVVMKLIKRGTITSGKALRKILLIACRSCNIDIVKYLVESVGIKPHYCSLIEAAISGHLGIVKYLVGFGVDICAEKYSSIRKSWSGSVRNYLIEHMDNGKDIFILIWAIRMRCFEAIQTFLKYKKGIPSMYALRCSAETGSEQIVRCIAEAIHEPDCNYAFIAAAAVGSLDVVRYFITKQNVLNVKHAIAVASKYGNFKTVRYLVENTDYGSGLDLDRAAYVSWVYAHFDITGYFQQRGASLNRYLGVCI
jgi:ankyrin repeat protein